MSRHAALRLLAFALLLGALKLTGLVSFDLPWGDPDFQVTGATVLLYIAWSIAGAPPGGSGDTTSALGAYAVLAVSAVDGLLLELTPIPGDPMLRWAGPVIFAAGSIARLLQPRPPRRQHRCAQLVGLPIGFSSIAGLVVAVIACLAPAGAAPRGEDEGAGTEGR